MNDQPIPLEEEVCGDCIYCQPGPKTKEDVLSRVCYRNPPTACAMLTQQGIAIISIRPEIRVDTHACGEYLTEDDLNPGMPTLAGSAPGGMTS